MSEHFCDPCAFEECQWRGHLVVSCPRFIPKPETNYEKLFGTPERTVRTLAAIGGRYPCDETAQDCDDCPLEEAPCRLNRDKPEESKLLEWLIMEGESDGDA